MLLHMLLFGVFASNYAPFWGPDMLQRGDYARETCYFVVHFLFIFYSTFFFGVAQALKRRLCSCICYFSVFLHSIMLHFWGSNMLAKRRLCS